MSRLRIGADRQGGAPVARPGEIARGDYWSIVREGDEYILCFLSHAPPGREKRIELAEREARDIADGRVSVGAYLAPGIAIDAPRPAAIERVDDNGETPALEQDRR